MSNYTGYITYDYMKKKKKWKDVNITINNLHCKIVDEDQKVLSLYIYI